VVPTCDELGISQIVWSPIAQGVLTGKYPPGEPPPADSRAADKEAGSFMGGFFEKPQLLERVQNLKPIAADLGLSMAQLAVAWVLQNPNVGSAIVGASRPQQVHDNAKASGVKLEADVLAKIDEVLGDSVVRDPALTAG
jgi:aryl-alcohol dehydrogenase-like predicted oxidoreductase